MARTRPTALAAAALLVTAALSSTAAASVDLRGISPELQERLRAAPTVSAAIYSPLERKATLLTLRPIVLVRRWRARAADRAAER
jgi:hypothetical protein